MVPGLGRGGWRGRGQLEAACPLEPNVMNNVRTAFPDRALQPAHPPGVPTFWLCKQQRPSPAPLGISNAKALHPNLKNLRGSAVDPLVPYLAV